MCIICISNKGTRQPNTKEIRTMWEANPHGAGYMFLNKDNDVEIHKGFMELDDFLRAVKSENFTADDVVIYHFRISTQAGVNPEMTHPFPLSRNIEDMKALDLLCHVGIAHNGIIPLTTDKNDKEYSDTAHFIAEYLPQILHYPEDLKDDKVLKIIQELAKSKLAILDNTGHIALIGHFITDDSGLIYSNGSYKEYDTDLINLWNRDTWKYKK